MCTHKHTEKENNIHTVSMQHADWHSHTRTHIQSAGPLLWHSKSFTPAWPLKEETERHTHTVCAPNSVFQRVCSHLQVSCVCDPIVMFIFTNSLQINCLNYYFHITGPSPHDVTISLDLSFEVNKNLTQELWNYCWLGSTIMHKCAIIQKKTKQTDSMVALCSASMVTAKQYFSLLVVLCLFSVSSAYSNIDFSPHSSSTRVHIHQHTNTSKRSFTVFAFAQIWTQTSTQNSVFSIMLMILVWRYNVLQSACCVASYLVHPEEAYLENIQNWTQLLTK